jgi:hypothetical protein
VVKTTNHNPTRAYRHVAIKTEARDFLNGLPTNQRDKGKIADGTRPGFACCEAPRRENRTA